MENAPEQRTITADLQDVRAEGRTLRGHACFYGVESRDLGGYTEQIQPGAFSDVLAGEPDVLLTVNHSPDKVLARTGSGTLRLRDEARGLAFEADLGDGPTAQDVRDMVRRSDLSGASFRFSVAQGGERWEGERRTLTRIGELHDISLATVPAYDGPRVELRTRPEPTTENTSASADTTQEDTMQTTDRESGGGLAVEDRSADAPTIEQRVLDGLRSIRKGEARSLTTSTADPIAPPELSSFVFDRLRASSVALASGIRVIATDRESIEWPKITADAAPAWFAETDTITPGDPAFATLTATPRKLAHIVELSNEIIDDSQPAIVDVLNGHLAQVLGLKLDLAVFEGNPAGNANSITGLKYAVGTGTVSMGANGAALSDLDPFADALGQLDAANAKGGAIVMHPRTWNAVRKLKDTQGRPLVGNGSADAPPTIFGVPVYVTSQLSTTEAQGTSTVASSVYVYDPAQVVMVRRQDAAIELDRSRLFNRDMSEMRGRVRADLLVPNPSAVTRITGIAA